jgi:type II secretory pathway pseudopilin PulG
MSNPTMKTLPSIPVDNTAPVLITVGILMIVLPVFGLVGLFVYQRRQQRARVMQEAQQVRAAQQFRRRERLHTGPIQAVPAVNRSGLPSQTYSSPTSTQTGGTLWKPTYPALDERENAYSPPFIPFQENSGMQPKPGESAPQE